MNSVQTRVVVLMLCLWMAACGAPRRESAPEPTPTRMPTQVAASATPTPAQTPSPSTGAETPGRPLLMAHFMPWYQTPDVSGYWGWHWTMNHFDPDQTDAQGRPEIASYVFPLTGPYDSSDDAVLEYQVLLMKLSGIDGVIVDWYGMDDFRDYGVLNASTQKLFEAVRRAGLRFAICYEDQAIKHMVEDGYLSAGETYARGQAVMQYLQDRWFSDEAYLQINGQPALFVFGPQYFTRAADWDKLFSVLPTRPAFFTLDGHTESTGLASYPWPPMWASQDGVLSQAALTDYLTGFYAKAERRDAVVGGSFPGFRDIYQDAGVASEARYLDPQQGETFRATLRLALDANPDIIQLITWNDYGESTTIEPTAEYGYAYLEMVQEARRTSGGDDFAYSAVDLRLPLQLFERRKQYAGDPAVNAKLDEAVAALLAGDTGSAHAIIVEYPTTP